MTSPERGDRQHDSDAEEIARINEAADELNREAEDVLEYQVILGDSSWFTET
jgi:hypothetical protein